MEDKDENLGPLYPQESVEEQNIYPGYLDYPHNEYEENNYYSLGGDDYNDLDEANENLT